MVAPHATAPAGAAASATLAESAVDFEAGLPRLLADAESSWLEQALRRYPRLRRAELAEKLKISESALYKKLRLYGLSD